jgi:hypothetical protein
MPPPRATSTGKTKTIKARAKPEDQEQTGDQEQDRCDGIWRDHFEHRRKGVGGVVTWVLAGAGTSAQNQHGDCGDDGERHQLDPQDLG